MIKMKSNYVNLIITVAIIIQIINCDKTLEIAFIADFQMQDFVKSSSLNAFVCWKKVEKYQLLNRMFENNISTAGYSINQNNFDFNNSLGNLLFFVDLDCEYFRNIMTFANQQNLFASPLKWLLLTKNKEYIEHPENYFLNYNFYVDSLIIIAFKSKMNEYTLTEIYKYDKFSDYFCKRKLTIWTFGEGFKSNINVKPTIRKDLNGTLFKSSVVVLNNGTYNHLTDYRFKHIDTITKVNFPLTNHLIDFVNGSKNFTFVNTWGYFNKTDKMYTGMIGALQRNMVEIGGTALFMTSDRVPIIEYVSMTTPTRAKFIFRQPPLSYVTNVFTLPFSRDVWLSSLLLCILASILLYIAVSVEWRQSHLDPSSKSISIPPSLIDSVMVTIGAVAQQGADREPRNVAGRSIMLFAFTALMFLYVSYSANIVALLQSSATNIRTLEDLLHSRLKLGVDDIVYNHYYFETATEPIRKALYEQKVAPKGQKPNYMKLDAGIAKIREGFFAFHGEQGVVYKLIGDTFFENEKCGLQEIQFIQVVDPYMAIKKNSSYKELLKIGLRLIRESGIQSREVQRLYTNKPECHSSGGNFVSVGLIDSYPAFLVLGCGIGVAILMFLIEKVVDFKKSHT